MLNLTTAPYKFELLVSSAMAFFKNFVSIEHPASLAFLTLCLQSFITLMSSFSSFNVFMFVTPFH